MFDWLWIVLVAVAALLVVIAVVMFWTAKRGVTKARTRVDDAWSEIRGHVQHRGMLVARVEDTLRARASHESGALMELEAARGETLAAERPSALSSAENRLQSALRGAFHIAEGYPELQTDRDFLELRSELSKSENQVQASRRFYNGAVREFNAKTKTFPSSLVTKGEDEREFFDAADRAAIAEPPRIQF